MKVEFLCDRDDAPSQSVFAFGGRLGVLNLRGTGFVREVRGRFHDERSPGPQSYAEQALRVDPSADRATLAHCARGLLTQSYRANFV